MGGLELQIAQLSGSVYEVHVPGPKPKSWIPLVAKVAAGEGDIPRIEKEIRAYQALAGKGVTPRFEGSVTENGMIIGFLMSKVKIKRSTGPDDRALWRPLLDVMHASGIAHGNPTLEHLLLEGYPCERAVAVGFSECWFGPTQEEKDGEITAATSNGALEGSSGVQ